MIVATLVVLPLLMALAVWLLRGKYLKELLIAEAWIHLLLVLTAFCTSSVTVLDFLQEKFDFAINYPVSNLCELQFGGILLKYNVNDPGMYVLGICGVLFFFVARYFCKYFKADSHGAMLRNGHAKHMKDYSAAALMLLFLGTMTLTALAQDYGTLWVAVEATTLVSAPLIHFHSSKSSLEATWKYLLLCSLGIGMALFGTMLMSAALPQVEANAVQGTIWPTFGSLGQVDAQWYKAAFVFCFAGYGLKAGLAPFHSWLPDAHSEAPAPVSALLSGSLLNCAMLALWRVREAAPEGLSDFCDGFFIFFGFLSLLIAALFIINQKDYKRMLAYSSVEHMGLIALMIGFGMKELLLIHVIFHSLTKMMLFLTAGNLLLAFNTRRIQLVQGVFSRLPRNGAIWMIGMLMICGTPPSPLFFTELALVRQAGMVSGSLILLLLFVIFCAMADLVIKMCMGQAREADFPEIDKSAEALTGIPSTVLAIILLTGLYLAAQIVLAQL